MPISSLASYLSTMQEFITHWTAVNVDLGAGGPLVLNGPYAVADLTASRTALQTKIIAVEAAENNAQQWANERDNRKAPLLERLRQFRAMVQGLLPTSPFVQGLPLQPAFNEAPGGVLKALDDMASLWSNINTSPPDGFTGPLKLQGGYLLATFNTDLGLWRTALTTHDGAMQSALIAREVRNQLLPPIKNHLVLYRQAVMGYYAKGHAMIESLPRLYPAAGSTPDAVMLSAAWNATLGQAVLTWTASDNPKLNHYEVRACDPPRYKTDNESVVEHVPAGTCTLTTSYGLLAPGAVKIFKVYVVTNDDNEKGSNAVGITHPE